MLSGSDERGFPSVDAGDYRAPDEAPQAAEAPEPAADAAGHVEESPGPGRYDQSRWNSTKEGLRARLLLPEALQAAADQRTAAYTEEFKPATAYTRWLVSEIGLATAKVDQAEEMLRLDARRRINRAASHWQHDRHAHAQDLGLRFGRESMRVLAELLKTPQGIAVVLGFWRQLGDILTTTGTWNESQRRTAFDLLGIPHSLREGSLEIPKDADTATLARIVERQTSILRGRMENEQALDRSSQEMSERGMPMIDDPVTRRLRRGLSEARRDYKRARDELRRIQEGAKPDERMAAEAEARPARTSPGAAMAQPAAATPPPDAPLAEVVLHPSVANDPYLALIKQDVEDYLWREHHKRHLNSQTPPDLPPRDRPAWMDPNWKPPMPHGAAGSPTEKGGGATEPSEKSDAA
jgi:hypothetical protein